MRGDGSSDGEDGDGDYAGTVTAIDVIVRVKGGDEPRPCPMERFEQFLK